MTDVTEDHLQRASELLAQSNELVSRSTDAVMQFEDVLRAQHSDGISEMSQTGGSTRALTSRLRNLEHDLYDLLDLNAKIAADTKGMCSDVQLTLRRQHQHQPQQRRDGEGDALRYSQKAQRR